MTPLHPGLREFLKFAGKGEQKVAAIFGVSPEGCDAAVRYVRRGVPDLPVWLYASRDPWAETAALCERVRVVADSMELLVAAQKELWERWVALSVGTWTGERGKWPVKAAPFLTPPFRALLMNRQGDFFPGTPAAVARHLGRAARDAAHSGWSRVKDIHRGVWLWVFGTVAQRFLWLIRRAFARWRGVGALEVPPCPPAGEGVAVYRYRHDWWDRAELERLVNSGCRRILLLDGDIEDDLPWPGGDEIFAVSRQPGFRGWKVGLFPTAPFRQLQPGEISRTLAPVSHAMLVDRAKLAALGIPETSLPGTAWLILFWKAAAAGWHSYSLCSARPLKELPDRPCEEAEFAVRVLADPRLRALGPREPDLARGAIARPAAGSRAGVGDRPRVLVVSPYLPWPLSHGGAVRIWNLCRALAGRTDFTLACFREKDDSADYARLGEVFREVYVVDRDEKAARDPGLPSQVREYASAAMRALIVQLAPRMDVLQVEYTHMAAFREAAPRLPAILVEHDLTFTLHRQLAMREETRAARLEYGRWLEFERRWLAAYDAVWTMSEEDRDAALAEGSPPQRTHVVANGVDTERFAPCRGAVVAQEVLCVGSFRHLPNILGFEKLRQEVMPRVWRRFPEARLRVVAGPEPARYWTPRPLDSRLEMHAFVPDLRPFYARAALGVTPLPVSAGTNIKVMEAMACGKPVVSTPVGCQGLGLRDGEDVVIRDDWEGFAEAVCDLLGSPELRARIGAEARRTVERRFGWDAIAAEAWRSYCALTEPRP